MNEQTKVSVAYWNYTEQETTAVGESDDLGSEIDVIATYKYNNAVTIDAGLAHFMPGDGNLATPTSPDDAREWAYLQYTGNF